MNRSRRVDSFSAKTKYARGDEFEKRGKLRQSLVARGLERVTSHTAERLAIYGVVAEKHNTSPVEIDPDQCWVPTWTMGLLLAEPTLPDTREAAFKDGFKNEETRRAIASAYALGKREAVAELINEMFPTEGF
jgi:hypothetical protein